MPNADLLYETLDAVIAAAAEDRWIQGEWFTPLDANGEVTDEPREWCGTAGCFAGHRVFLDGGRPLVRGWCSRSMAVFPNGRVYTVEQYATDRLGLTMLQAERLFRGSNTLDDLKQIVDEIAGGRA